MISLTYIGSIDLCVLCVRSGSFHSLALEECILEYILPTKPGRAGKRQEARGKRRLDMYN
ncbi:hypothetical protein MICAI_630004 [Microcystis sp. T1-4]|nr:hypothetical protein MICAI_630004 [Microcystis sp. T1-4]